MWASKHSKKGQSLAEYGLLMALIAVFCIAGLTTVGQATSNVMNSMNDQILNAASVSGGGFGGAGGGGGIGSGCMGICP